MFQDAPSSLTKLSSRDDNISELFIFVLGILTNQGKSAIQRCHHQVDSSDVIVV